MGLFDSILGKGSKSPEASAPAKSPVFALAVAFRPLRLNARSENSVDLLMHLTNLDEKPVMCSVVIELPKGLGFDGVGLHKTKELRLGNLEGKVEKELAVTIVGNNQTPPGLYRIQVTAYSHYRDYAHVLNSVSKTIELRVV